MPFRSFDIAFAIAQIYMVLYVIIGIRVHLKGDAASDPYKRINLFSLWPADLMRSIRFILLSWPKDLLTRVMVVAERILFVVYFVFFLHAVTRPLY